MLRSNLVSLILSLTLLLTNSLLWADESSERTVNNATWQMKEEIAPSNILEKKIKPNMASLYFVRPLDEDVIQSSANLAINGRFHVSLQPGNFTHVYSCAGINQISAVSTHKKSNDLSANPKTVNLRADKNYFFIVNVNNIENTAIEQINQEQALDIMSNQTIQEHQISRISPTCVAQNRLKLNILFDNDEFVVKPQYYTEIAKLADLLANSPQTSLTIEGHTDNKADAFYNDQLSLHRANAVKSILVQKYGISAHRIHSIGYGQSNPIADNSTLQGRQQNRRVIAVFSEL